MTRRLTVLAVAVLVSGAVHRASADNPLEAKYGPPRADPAPEIPLPDIDPAPRRALRYLGHVQHATGGWGHFDVPAASPPGRGLVRPPDLGDGMERGRRLYFPPTLAETGAALGAFCAAGVSPAQGPAAKPLQAALAALERQAGGVLAAPAAAAAGGDDRAIEAARACGVTRALLTPALDIALALDGVLAYRAVLPPADRAGRTRADHLAGTLIARLRAQQRTGGGWEMDEKVEGTFGYLRKMRDSLPPAERSHWWFNPAPAHPVLADAFTARTLLAASRAGLLAADDELTRGIVAYLQDLAGPGAIANEEPGTFYRSVIQLSALHQLWKLADTEVDRLDRWQALSKAQDDFFKALRAARSPAGGKVHIAVPVSSVDLLADFLLIEALAGSTHADARPTVAGIVDVVARKQRDRGGWEDPNRDDALGMHWRMLGGLPTDGSLPVPRPSNHLVTALGARVLLMAPKP